MCMEICSENGVVRKIAQCEQERARLAAEATVLAKAAHPGVVRLVRTAGGDPPSELVLCEVRGDRLADVVRHLDLSEIAGLGAAVATTLADLHDIGVVHGAVSAEHILLDEEGRPVLCGFGSADHDVGASEARIRAADDVSSLAVVLSTLGGAALPRGIARLLRSFIHPGHIARRRTARRLARSLIESVPTARLPGSDPLGACSSSSVGPHTQRQRGLSRAVLALVCASVAGGILFGVGAVAVGGAALGAGCPRVDDGCVGRPVVSGAVISAPAGSFRLVGVQGVEVVGRWSCGASGLPVVLNLAGGNVWVFDRWPADPSGVAGKLAATVPAASGLRVVPSRGAESRCDRVLVERRRLLRRGRAPYSVRPPVAACL
jgi:tRNA A-37 threonylcarbamoyl transferase component Bud32